MIMKNDNDNNNGHCLEKSVSKTFLQNPQPFEVQQLH